MKNNELKSANKLSILRCLYQTSCSRADLAKLLALSKASVSSLVEQLENEGLVREIGRGTSGEAGGKKPIIISVNPFAALILAIHFDGSLCGIAFTDMCGEILGKKFFPVILYADYAKTFDFILEQVALLKAELSEYTDTYRLVSCGISVKGLIDSVYGVIKYTSAVADWTDIPVGRYFADRLGILTWVENDARAVSCRESVYGSRSENDMIASVCIESGIGVSLLLGNRIIRGSFFGAVNFAHTTVDRDGPLCRCGKRGCWETLASLDALTGRVRAAAPEYVSYTLEDICASYAQGDEKISRLILDEFCFWVGVGVANILTVFNPRKLVLYGYAALFDQAAQTAILRTIGEYTNKVAAKTQIIFKHDIQTLHLKAAAAVVIKRFLSPEAHGLFL